MKIILSADIKGVGKKNEIKDLSPGYVRNFLLPKKLATLATPQALKLLEIQKKKESEEEGKTKELLEKLKEEKGLVFYLKVGPNQEIYNSVTAEEIEREFTSRGFPDAKVKLERPIKALGETEIEVNLGKGIAEKITIAVQPRLE